MRKRRHKALLALALSVAFVLGGCTGEETKAESRLKEACVSGILKGKEMFEEPESDAFLKLVSEGDFEGMSLVIYYVGPNAMWAYPTSIDELVDISSNELIVQHGIGGIAVANGEELARHAGLLYLLASEELVPLGQDYRMDARVYCVFKDKYNRKIFEVAMWGRPEKSGSGSATFINGVYVEDKDIYYDIFIPFLPEKLARAWEEQKPSSQTQDKE